MARSIPIINYRDTPAFEFLWASGIPMVVDVPQDSSSGLWSPSIFMRGHEEERVIIIKQTQDGKQEELAGTLRSFMQLFELPDADRGYCVKLKVCLFEDLCSRS